MLIFQGEKYFSISKQYDCLFEVTLQNIVGFVTVFFFTLEDELQSKDLCFTEALLERGIYATKQSLKARLRKKEWTLPFTFKNP